MLLLRDWNRFLNRHEKSQCKTIRNCKNFWFELFNWNFPFLTAFYHLILNIYLSTKHRKNLWWCIERQKENNHHKNIRRYIHKSSKCMMFIKAIFTSIYFCCSPFLLFLFRMDHHYSFYDIVTDVRPRQNKTFLSHFSLLMSALIDVCFFLEVYMLNFYFKKNAPYSVSLRIIVQFNAAIISKPTSCCACCMWKMFSEPYAYKHNSYLLYTARAS